MDSCRSRFGIGWLLACVLALLCVFAVLPQGEARAANALARKALPESEPSLVTDTTKLNGTNWMSGVSGSLYLHEITIPGTHDAAMWDPFSIGDLLGIQKAAYRFSKTQTLSIKEQLNAGVRLFDLRVTNSYPRSNQAGCYLVHGKVIKGTDWRYYGDMPGDKVLTLDDILTWVQDFLRAHPTETIILDVSYESDSGYKDGSLVQAATRLQRYGSEINPSTNKTYMHYQNGDLITQMPTLSDVRGQFVVITTESDLRYGMQYPWGPGWAPTTIGGVPFARENHYESSAINKISYIWSVYNGGSVGNETFSNPTGGYKQQIPRSASQDVVGQGATVMTSSNRAPGACDPPWASPSTIADYVNPFYYTLDYYQKHSSAGEGKSRKKVDPTFVAGRLFGWVYSDFVTEQTSRTLWSTNFPSDLKHVNLTYQITNPATGKTDEKTMTFLDGSIVTLPKSLFGDAARDYELVGWEDASGKLIEGATYQLPTDQKGTVVLKARLALTWHGLQTKINAAKNNDTIVLDRNLTAVGADVSLTIPAGKKLTIDLAGHTLNRNAWRTSDGGNVLQLRERSELVLMNGILKGGDAPRGGGVLVRKNATFDAINVRIEDNRAEQRGGGVYVEANGMFKMYPQNGTLSFEPNVITNNRCRVGAGVYAEADGKLYFKGKANVTGNKLSQWESAENNVYLAGTSTIELDQDVNVESRIGVSVEKAPIAGKPAVISSGGGAAKTSVFSSDDKRYTVGLWQAQNYYDATALYSGCTVTFDHADGQGNTTVRPVAYNTSVDALAAPKRTGYDFMGWYSDKECTQPYDFTKSVTSNMTLYAKWNVARHTVTFDADNGQNPTTETVTHGQAVQKPDDPTREGYTFAGWTVQKTILDSNWQPKQEWVAYRFSLPVTSDVTLKAQWKIDRPTVTFDANGGSFAGDPATNTKTAQVDYGTPVARPTTAPTRDHAALMGWYTDQACTRAYDFSLPVKGDMTLYAGWQLDRREVRFATFGGTPAPANQIVGYGERATKPQDPTRVGYAFKGWSTSENALVPYDFSAGVTAPILELYAIWDVTVTFDTQDGKTTTQIVQRGTMLNKPDDPVREGFTFAGWYQDIRTRYVPYQFGAISVNEPMKLVARWVPKSYTASFNTNGGTAVAAQTIVHGAKVPQPNNPSKPGFTFTGWFTDAECTKAYDFNSSVTGDTILHAGWRASEYTVTFNANGGKFSDETTTKKYENIAHGSALQNPPGDPTRAEYVFCGWYRDEGFTQPYDFSAPVTSNLTLHAKWEKMRYDVVFVANGGAFASGTEHVQTVASGTEASTVEPAGSEKPTRAGYEFAGWCTDRACTQTYGFDGTIASDLILYAKWTQITHSVTFNANGGSFRDGTASHVCEGVAHGSVVAEPEEEPTRTGYIFAGWRITTGGADVSYDFDEPVTSDFTLTAAWESDPAVDCLVVFMSNGALIKVQAVESGVNASTIAKPADPTRAGYEFAGWCIDRACTQAYSFDGTVDSDLFLYAKWTPVKHSVTFNANGGSFSDETTSKTYENIAHGSALQNPPGDPTRAEHVFCGWFTRTGSEGSYAYRPYDPSAPVTSDLALYAKWEAMRYDVVFVANGGAFNDSSTELVQTVASGTDASTVKPTDPERNGCAFAGWCTDRACTQTYDFDGGTIASDLILYAKWTTTVTFSTHDGSTIDPLPVAVGSPATRPETDPAKPGNLFTGWYADEACSQPYDFNAPIEQAVTVHAGWAPETRKVTFEAHGGKFADGSETKSVQVDYDVAVPELQQGEKPTLDGYSLLGWYSDGEYAKDEGAQPYDFSTKVKSDIVLHAKWAADKHAVTFNANGGSFAGDPATDTKTAQVDHDLAVDEPDDPTREGYTFDGWCTRTGSEGSYAYTPYDFDNPVTGDFTLYAKWALQPHYVTFVVEGDATAPEAQIVLHGGFATQPAVSLHKDGYDFTGWRTADGKEFDFANTPVTQNLVLHAGWSPKNCTVAFNTYVDGSTTVPQAVVVGSSATRPGTDPTKANHSFQGWFADLDTNLTADEIAKVEALIDEDPETEAYLWLDGTTLRVLYDFEDPVRGNLTLHARWAADKHEVTFVHNDDESATTTEQVDHNGLATAPEIANTERRLFAGWYRDKACTRPFSLSQPITGDITLYAKWVPKLYNVTFVTCGGSEIKPLAVASGTIANPPANPTKDGCRFIGWYTSDSYADSERFDLSTKAITGDTVLYAKWDLLSHAVHFNAEGGQPVPSDQVVQDGGMATKPGDPSFDGHDFVGWFADCATNLGDDEVATIKAELEKDPTLRETFWLEGNALRVRCDFDDPVYADLSLHARWEQTKHTVTFIYDGNEVSAISVPDGQAVPSEGIPWQVGDDEGAQTFTGWFADEALTSAYDFNMPVKSDLTLYARWTDNAYTVTFNSEGGSEVNPKSMSVAYGEQINEPEKPTKYGCTFEGWYEDTGETATQAELDASIDEFISGLAAAAETDEEKAAVEEYRQELSDKVWVNNGTAFVRYDFEGDAIYENTDLHARWNEGALTTEVVLGEGAPQVTAPNLRDVALKEAAGDEIAQNVHVWLQVEASSESSVAQKDRDALAATLGKLGCTSGLWLDLSLSKRVGGEAGSVQALHETQEPLQLSVEMPAALRNFSANVVRTFYLLRVHDGEVATIAEGAEPTLQGTTDRFSTYLIAYKDSAAGAAGSTTQSTTPKTQSQQKAPLPVTGDPISLYLLVALGLLGVAAIVIAVRKKRNN